MHRVETVLQIELRLQVCEYPRLALQDSFSVRHRVRQSVFVQSRCADGPPERMPGVVTTMRRILLTFTDLTTLNATPSVFTRWYLSLCLSRGLLIVPPRRVPSGRHAAHGAARSLFDLDMRW